MEKQILSATSLRIDIAPETFLERYPRLLIATYASSARFHTSLVKELPTPRRVRMMESPRSTPLPGLAMHRRQRGLTQRQLGEISGVAHTTVQRLESLKRGAYPQTMQKLATALRMEPKDLL